jgi:AAA ATPase domain
LAEPDTVVIDDSTRRLLGGLFEYRDLGVMSVKGFDDPVPAWRVLRASMLDSRFEALRSGVALLVGRDEEGELLRRRWQQVKSGKGRAVLIIGELAIGKSRLTAALQEYLQDDTYTRLRHFCSPACPAQRAADPAPIQHTAARNDFLLEIEECISILPIAPIDSPSAPAFDPLDRHGRLGQCLLLNEGRADFPEEFNRCPSRERIVLLANAALLWICHSCFSRVFGR